MWKLRGEKWRSQFDTHESGHQLERQMSRAGYEVTDQVFSNPWHHIYELQVEYAIHTTTDKLSSGMHARQSPETPPSRMRV
jgi:hypothetical protein